MCRVVLGPEFTAVETAGLVADTIRCAFEKKLCGSNMGGRWGLGQVRSENPRLIVLPAWRLSGMC